MSSDPKHAGIRRIAAPLDEALAGALGMGRVAELTHLPTGIPAQQYAVLTLEAAGATSMPAADHPALLHVTGGRLLVHGPAGEPLPAAAGDTLLVPAGVSFRAFNPSESAPVQLLLVRGG